VGLANYRLVRYPKFRGENRNWTRGLIKRGEMGLSGNIQREYTNPLCRGNGREGAIL